MYILFYSQGMAIGICPKDKIFKGYIELELQLREFDRCRILYEKFLEFNPENCTTWMKVRILAVKNQNKCTQTLWLRTAYLGVVRENCSSNQN